MLSPLLGLFLSRDLLSAEGNPMVLYDNNSFGRRLDGMREQAYAYAKNNPVRYTDPSGLKTLGMGGTICISANCDHDFVTPDEDHSIWRRCAPGTCCDADGVWGSTP